MSRSRFRRSRSRRLPVGVGTVVALVLAGSSAFTSSASAAPRPLKAIVSRDTGTFTSGGETCVVPFATLIREVPESGTYYDFFDDVTCGRAVLVQGVEYRVHCEELWGCITQSATVHTALTHPGAWYYWTQPVPRRTTPADVRIDWAGDSVSTGVWFIELGSREIW